MKNKILEILIEHMNGFVSGEAMAQSLNVSRVSVSKHIKTLRKEGYQIISSPKKGYCLTYDNDLLSASFIQEKCNTFYQIHVIDTISSTNDFVKANAQQLPEGYVLIADMQQKGRGRNGRSFYCEAHKGIYLSLLLKPSFSLSYSLKLTACAAVAAIESIQLEYGITPSIKWVNDLLLHDKKIAGILCEASIEINQASLEYMIIGIGINVHRMDLPDELKEIAASIEDMCDKTGCRNQIIIHFLNRFYHYYATIQENTFLSYYRHYSCLLDKYVNVYEQNTSYSAKVIGIDEEARLLIETQNKEKRVLSSGEISIRKQE